MNYFVDVVWLMDLPLEEKCVVVCVCVCVYVCVCVCVCVCRFVCV